MSELTIIAASKPQKAGFGARIICALLSFLLPGLGQAVQQRFLRAFDFLILYGASVVIALLFVIQMHKGIYTPIVMIGIVLIPSLLAFFDALFNESHPGDADTIVRSFFLFLCFYLITIGPFHFINKTVGFKVFRLSQASTQLEPFLLPGDAVIFDRDAYGMRTPGAKMSGHLVEVGDIVYHESNVKDLTHEEHFAHIVLAAPGDTLVSRNGVITVNSIPLEIPKSGKFSGEINFGPIVVPRDELFVIDNTLNYFPIFLNTVVGKAIGILWSKDAAGDYRRDRFGMEFDHIEILGQKPIVSDSVATVIDSLSIGNDIISTK